MVRWLSNVAALVCAAGLAGAAHADDALPKRLEGHGGPVRSVAVSADGRQVLTASFDYTAIHWSLGGGQARILKRLYGHEAGVNDALFLAQDRAATVSDDGSLAVWELASGEIAWRAAGNGAKVLDVAASGDGRLLATAGWDRTARVYDALSGSELAVVDEHRGNVNAVAFSADAGTLYTASYDGTILASDARTGEFRRRLESHGWGVNVLRRLSDGRLVFGALDGAAAIIDAESGARVADLKKHDGPVLALAVSPSGRLVATGGGDGRIRVYRTADGGLAEEYENPYGPVWSLAFAGDDDAIYYSGLDDFVTLWTISPRKPFEAVPSDFPRRFQVSAEDDLGRRQFARKCSVCHTLTPDGGHRAGPTLYDLFGRRAGGLPGYPYSKALAEADFVWNDETIDRLFELGPHEFTPGSKMPLQRITSRQKRRALIDYLRRATEPGRRTGRDGPATKDNKETRQ